MQLNDILAAIAPQTGASPASGAGGASADAGFGKALHTVLKAAGSAADAVGERPVGGKTRLAGFLSRLDEAAQGKGSGPAAEALAGLAGVLQQLLNASEPTKAAMEAGSSAVSSLQDSLGGVSADARQAVAGRIGRLLQQLDGVEQAVTGVDPKAPPSGWAEPQNFAQARALLTKMMGVVQQASAPATPDAQAAYAALQASAQTAAQAQLQTPAPATPPAVMAAALPASPSAAAAPADGETAVNNGTDNAVEGRTLVTNREPLNPKPAPGAHGQGGAGSQSDGDADSSGQNPDATPGQALAQADKAPVSEFRGASASALEHASEPQTAEAAPTAQPLAPTGPAPAPQEAVRALAADAARGSPETVAHLAAQIVKRADGKATQFEMSLHPADLGRVDIQMRIEQDGRLNAQLAFDNPLAAADLRGRADELRRSLEQAGFRLTEDSLSFSDRGAGASGRGFDQGSSGSGSNSGGGDTGRDSARARAFQNSDINARVADAAVRLQSRAVSGLDMRV